jgi:hypothetical protein
MHPHLTFVVAARNDNYGGDFLSRMRLFLTTLSALSKRHSLNAELVVVEWNPPTDRPPLRDAVRWPRKGAGLSVRIVTVPESRHQQLPNSAKTPMFEYIAKNAGIRRARGEYVLATNPDIIFSDQLVAHLAEGKLSPQCFQRVDRYDIDVTVPQALPLDKMLRFCSRHVVGIRSAGGLVDPRLGSLARRFLARPNPVRLIRWVGRKVKRHGRVGVPEPTEGNTAGLHLECSGDFLMMSREAWSALRGYPQLSLRSHIDSYMVFLAWFSGLRQLVLPYRIYHQDHRRPGLEPFSVLQDVPAFREMLETRRPVVTNMENWGLGDAALVECEVA